MNLDQLLRDSAPDSTEMQRQAERLRPTVLAGFHDAQRSRHRRRWFAVVATAMAAATAYVVVSPGGPAVSPAYAVTENADGDVVVTVHQLEDADGLEAALRDHGIDVDVSFNPSDGSEFWIEIPDSESGDRPPGEIPDRADAIDCEFGRGEPATLHHEADDWVLRIPAESPLQDRAVWITTNPRGMLVVGYEGSEPDTYCVVLGAPS